MKIPEDQESQIQQYFAGTSVFITGATGFLGKLIMEKLLRTCTDTKMIYILIRPKRGKTIEERFSELLDDVLFDVLKRKQPGCFKKITLVQGDLELPELGISKTDQTKLICEVNCVFHCGATVRFNEKIRTAVHINIRATKDILVLAKQMVQLTSFIYVSTAFSNCISKEINEEFYDSTISGTQLMAIVDTLSDDLLETITSSLLGKSPNTYVFTKAIAENVIKIEGKGLPIAVVRPSSVVSTVKEPLAGWTDNLYGPTGVTLGTALGLIRSLHCKIDGLAEIVPADFVVNCIIASAWNTATGETATSNEEKICNEVDDYSPQIYNYVSCVQNPITWRKFTKLSEKHMTLVPTPLLIWHYCVFFNESWFMHRLCVLLLHFIPAYIVDFFLYCFRKKPMMVNAYKKIDKNMNVMSYFATNQWSFQDNNTQQLWKKLSKHDKKLFDFDMSALDWDSYFYTYSRGGRVYLLKDPLDTLPQGRRKQLKLQIAHYVLVGLLLLALAKFFMIMWRIVF